MLGLASWPGPAIEGGIVRRRRNAFTASLLACLAGSALVAAGAAGPALAAAQVTTPTAAETAATAAAPSGQFYVVQAVPGQQIAISVDGSTEQRGVGVGGVVGPITVDPGKHEVRLESTSEDWAVNTTVAVKPGSSSDIVLHQPASTSGKPVINRYALPDQGIGPGKARVLVAHTATAPPADVRVDGQTVFTNIANGEYAEADLPGGRHEVALLPSGTDRGAFLGPLAVQLPTTTVTMVYAVGSPTDNSMRVVQHRADLASDGSSVPRRINTGSAAGLARDLVVAPLGR